MPGIYDNVRNKNVSKQNSYAMKDTFMSHQHNKLYLNVMLIAMRIWNPLPTKEILMTEYWVSS